VDFEKEKGFLAIYDKNGKLRLVYSSPVVHLSTNTTTALPLDWDAPTSTLSIALPDLSFPLVIGFGLSAKLPETKGGFHLSFPSFKFGAKGEIEAEDSESDDDTSDEEKAKAKGGVDVKMPKFGFGKKDKSPDISGKGKVCFLSF
jgi:hypothetical protein